MPIDDPVAVAFANQQVRPNAETTRAAAFQLSAYLAAIEAGGAALFPEGGGAVEDGRQATEGVAQVTADEVRAFNALAAGIAAVFAEPANAAGVAAMHKLCVRPPRFLAVSATS